MSYHLIIQEVADNLKLLRNIIKDESSKNQLETNIKKLEQISESNTSSFFLHNNQFKMIMGEVIDNSPENLKIVIGRESNSLEIVLELNEDGKLKILKNETSTI